MPSNEPFLYFITHLAWWFGNAPEAWTEDGYMGMSPSNGREGVGIPVKVDLANGGYRDLMLVAEPDPTSPWYWHPRWQKKPCDGWMHTGSGEDFV